MTFMDSASMYLIIGTILGFILGFILQQFKIRKLSQENLLKTDINKNELKGK